jgi:hypothetical protein
MRFSWGLSDEFDSLGFLALRQTCSVVVEQFVNGYLAIFHLDVGPEGPMAMLCEGSDLTEEENEDQGP